MLDSALNPLVRVINLCSQPAEAQNDCRPVWQVEKLKHKKPAQVVTMSRSQDWAWRCILYCLSNQHPVRQGLGNRNVNAKSPGSGYCQSIGKWA